MRQRTKRTAPTSAGFTIVELLVATAVTAVLIGLMITMTSGVLTAWNRTSGTLTANNQGKIILDQVAQDLQSAIFRYDPSNPGAVALAVEILDQVEGHNVGVLRTQRGWITTGPQSGILKPTTAQDRPRSFDLEPLDIAEARYGFGGAYLRFFSNNLNGTEVQNSAGTYVQESNTLPGAIGYQIIRRHITDSPANPNPAEVRYMMFRSEVADLTDPPGGGTTKIPRLLDDGYDLADPDPNHYANVNAQGFLINPRNDRIIGNNVIDFGLRLYIRSPGALDAVFPVVNYPINTRLSDNHTQYLADGSPTNPFPDVADIMVRILTEEGARQIQNLEAGRIFQNLNDAQRREQWWDIAEANSRVFTRRVYLNARSY